MYLMIIFLKDEEKMSDEIKQFILENSSMNIYIYKIKSKTEF